MEEECSFSKHSAVIADFGKNFAKTGKVPQEFHQYLINAFNKRNIADYDAEVIVEKADAELQIKRAEEFLNFAENYLNRE